MSRSGYFERDWGPDVPWGHSPGNLLNALKAGATWSRASGPRFADLSDNARPKISPFQSNGTDSVGFHASNSREFVSPLNDDLDDSTVPVVSIR